MFEVETQQVDAFTQSARWFEPINEFYSPATRLSAWPPEVFKVFRNYASSPTWPQDVDYTPDSWNDAKILACKRCLQEACLDGDTNGYIKTKVSFFTLKVKLVNQKTGTSFLDIPKCFGKGTGISMYDCHQINHWAYVITPFGLNAPMFWPPPAEI